MHTPRADGSPSNEFLMNENLLALFHFQVVYSLDASATAKRSKKANFRQHIAYYRALTAKGVDWRAQLQNLLEKWAEFKELTKRKRVSGHEVLDIGDIVQVVDSRLL
jgi:hypothetical protein